jgi:hypothetical protein
VHEHIKKEGGEVVDKARPAGAAGPSGFVKLRPIASFRAFTCPLLRLETKEEKSDDASAVGGDVNHALVRNLIQLHARYDRTFSAPVADSRF